MDESKIREFNKRVISLADGRRLIYYEFEPAQSKPINGTTTDQVQGKEG